MGPGAKRIDIFSPLTLWGNKEEGFKINYPDARPSGGCLNLANGSKKKTKAEIG